MASLRVGQDRETQWLILACNDGYLKVFDPFGGTKLVRGVKGVSGNPICLDVA